MNSKRKIYSLYVLNTISVLLLSTYIFYSCEKIEPLRTNKVITGSVNSVNSSSCVISGTIVDISDKGINQHGFCWATSQNPTPSNFKKQLGSKSSKGYFTGEITGLTINTKYYIRAYVQNEDSISYGDQLSFSTIIIGNDYQGGIVAYIFQSADPGYIDGETHGLIVSPSIQKTATEWGCIGTDIGIADIAAIGTGFQNTIDILAGCSTSGIAARLCGDLVLSGYNDWFLPSIDELNLLYDNRLVIGGFSNYTFWSSTESSNINFAWGRNFSDGGQTSAVKTDLFAVRAVRAF